MVYCTGCQSVLGSYRNTADGTHPTTIGRLGEIILKIGYKDENGVRRGLTRDELADLPPVTRLYPVPHFLDRDLRWLIESNLVLDVLSLNVSPDRPKTYIPSALMLEMSGKVSASPETSAAFQDCAHQPLSAELYS